MRILVEVNPSLIESFEFVARKGKLPRIESFEIGDMAEAPSQGHSSTELRLGDHRRSPLFA
jgi:hypothetical protein